MIRFEPVDVMIKKIPIPIFAVALAQSALGNLMLLQGWPRSLYWIFGCFSMVSIILFLLKFMMYPKLIIEDIKSSPVLAGVSGGAFMALMQVATYLKNFTYEAAFVIWVVSVVGHIILLLWFTWRYVLVQHQREQFYPTYFLVYAGIAVASLTAPQFGMRAWGVPIFWISLLLFGFCFMVVVWRYVTQGPVPLGFKPFFCLFTAPPSLFLASWITLFSITSSTAIFVFLGIAQLFFLMVMLYVPRLFKLKFFPSYAALGFPFVITALAFQLSLNQLKIMGVMVPSWLSGVAFAEFIFCMIAVIYVTIWYISYIINYCIICRGPQTLH